MTGIEAADQVPYKPGRTRVEFMRAVRGVLRRKGISCVPAVVDKDGNCTVCGEAGRCPGVHTHEEYQYRPEVRA